MYYQNFYRMNHMPMHQQMDMMIPNSDLVKTLHDCSVMCYHTMANVLRQPDVSMRQNQINMLHSCARICESQIVYIVTDSPFSKEHALMCAMVCESCSKECAKHSDPLSQHCSKVCYDCAVSCRQYAEMSF